MTLEHENVAPSLSLFLSLSHTHTYTHTSLNSLNTHQVPSVISVTLAILFADGNSPMKLVDRHSLATEPEHMKVSQAVFESMRRYPPVVGFPWWNTAEKNDFRTVMNLAMAQRDPVAWGDDAESFVLRDLEKYAELMGVSWAAPETDWNPRDGWQESTGVHDYKGMARECPAKELSFVMSVEFIEGFLKDQIKNGSWKVQNNVEIHMTESTPFFNSFVLVRGLVENLGQCDSKKCELFEVAKEEIYKEMFPGAIDTRVPINLRGLFYMEGNPAPDDVASFGGSDWAFTDYQGYRGSNSDPSVDAQISVYGNRVWSWHNNALGKATYVPISNIFSLSLSLSHTHTHTYTYTPGTKRQLQQNSRTTSTVMRL